MDTVATQWHKRISNDFSLELEGEQLPVIKDASQGHLLGSELVISHLKDSDDGEEKKKLIGLLQFPWVDFLRGESF